MVTTLTTTPDKKPIERHLRSTHLTASVKGGAVMSTRHPEAEADQRERQARIEQDIRQLFARYRRSSEDSKRRESPRRAQRFAREAQRTSTRSR
jgi:hypothetical protein